MTKVNLQCDECGSLSFEMNTAHDAWDMRVFPDAYVAPEGAFVFEVTCNDCGWSEIRRMETKKVDNDDPE